MTLAIVVENGTNVSNANSYISLADANSYHSDMGNTTWTGTEAVKTLALVLATRSLHALYGKDLESYPQYVTQVMLFPRLGFYDYYDRWTPHSVIPQAIKDAQCEIALLHVIGTSIYPFDKKDNYLTQHNVSVGDISESKSYSKPVIDEKYDGFRKIDMLMFPYLVNSSKQITLHL